MFFIEIAKFFAKILYFILKLRPTKNKITMISRFNKETSIDFKLLRDEINRRNPNTEIVILNHKLKSKNHLIFDIIEEMYHISNSSTVIVDSYIIPISIFNHKKNLKVIQIWHALGAIKKFGYAAINKQEGAKKEIAKLMNMHNNYTYIITGGEKTIPYYAEAFGTKKVRIIPFSLPRVDYLVNSENETKAISKIDDRYPQLKGKKTILYAPTFRKGKRIEYETIINAIDLSKYNLIIKKHPQDKTNLANYDSIIVDSDFSTLDLLFITDILISDYSAVFFEASVLSIPIYCYTYDMAEYQEARGLFMDMKKLGFFTTNDPKKLLEEIETKPYNYEILRKFREDYVKITDGTSTKKIVDLVFD